MAYLNINELTNGQVLDWIKGLDDSVSCYVANFMNNDVTGKQLLSLSMDDLDNLQITKLGHKSILMEAVDLLKQVHYNLDTENLQSLTLGLSCKARSLYNELKYSDLNDSHNSSDSYNAGDWAPIELNSNYHKVPTSTLSAVADMLNTMKSLVAWLDRSPFQGQQCYVSLRNTLLNLSVELATNAQRDRFAENPLNVIRTNCLKIFEICDELVQDSLDSMTIQPAYLDVVTIKKKTEEELDLQIQSSYSGIHVIEGARNQNSSKNCGRLETGDEVIQVNGQIVLGWPLKKLMGMLKENTSEVVLTLKKRPRHVTVFGQLVTPPFIMPTRASPCARRAALNNIINTFVTTPALTNSLTKFEIPHNSSKPPIAEKPKPLLLSTKAILPAQAVIHETSISAQVEPELNRQPTKVNSTAGAPAVVASAKEAAVTPQQIRPKEAATRKVTPCSGQINHPILPKCRGLIQRRATITGGSPTEKRPPVVFDQWISFGRQAMGEPESAAPRENVCRSKSHDPAFFLQLHEIEKLKSSINSTDAGRDPFESTTIQDMPPDLLPHVDASKWRNRKKDKEAVVIVCEPAAETQTNKTETTTYKLSPAIIRRHISEKLQKLTTRVNVKDLGQGQCGGWLSKMDPLAANKSWMKYWCLLKENCFYMYKGKNDFRAEIVVYLSGYSVAPLPDLKQIIFRVYNDQDYFYMKADTVTDMGVWIRKFEEAIPRGEAVRSRLKSSDDECASIFYVDNPCSDDVFEGPEEKVSFLERRFAKKIKRNASSASSTMEEPVHEVKPKPSPIQIISDTLDEITRHQNTLPKCISPAVKLGDFGCARSYKKVSTDGAQPITPKSPRSTGETPTSGSSLTRFEFSKLIQPQAKSPSATSVTSATKVYIRERPILDSIRCDEESSNVSEGAKYLAPLNDNIPKMVLAFEMNLDSPVENVCKSPGSLDLKSHQYVNIGEGGVIADNSVSPRKVDVLREQFYASASAPLHADNKGYANVSLQVKQEELRQQPRPVPRERQMNPNRIKESAERNKMLLSQSLVESLGCESAEEVDDLQATYPPVQKPTMGVSMIGKQRRSPSQNSYDRTHGSNSSHSDSF